LNTYYRKSTAGIGGMLVVYFHFIFGIKRVKNTKFINSKGFYFCRVYDKKKIKNFRQPIISLLGALKSTNNQFLFIKERPYDFFLLKKLVAFWIQPIGGFGT
jgi:hypothetical protein